LLSPQSTGSSEGFDATTFLSAGPASSPIFFQPVVLTSAAGMEAIREADEHARRLRVEGVPFFIINGKITLSGAQPPDAFLEAFRQALSGT
jgi:hypothetical protein